MTRLSPLALVLSAACADGIVQPPEPSFEIVGGAHFSFLPPIAPDPGATGVFDGSLAPLVRICEWDGGGCSSTVAEFSTTEGMGPERVRVEDESYIVNWRTGRYDLDEDAMYRVAVFLDGLELGHADVDLVGKGSGRGGVGAGTTVRLRNGATLAIRFRIEEGAAPPPPTPGAVVYLNFDGVTLTASATMDDATTNTSALVQSAVATIGAFDPASLTDNQGLTRAEIIQETLSRMEAIHAPYDVSFTTVRPTSGPYQMVVFGGTCVGVLGQSGCEGAAILDCGDVMPNNIAFVFPWGVRVEDLAVLASRENAVALGLGYTDNPEDVMVPVRQLTPPERFAAGNIVNGSGCPASATFQDSHQRMLDVLGPGA